MSANAARRPRRGSSATTGPETAPAADSPATTDERADGPRPRRRGATGAGTRVVAFPEPMPSAYSTPPSLPALAPVPRVDPAPPVPREEPAVLHASDRRSFIPSVPSLPSFRSPSVEQLAIGELDQTLFDCPQCRRPLALGAHRCPGCGSLLVRSVLARKAALFAACGVLIGGLVGLGGGIVLGGGLAAASAGTVGATGSHEPSASAPAAAPSSSVPTPSSVPVTAPPASQPPVSALPFAVRSAFGQILAMNADRLAAAEGDLRAALAAPTFDASDVASTLRMVSAQSLFGSQLAAQVAGWPGAGDLGGQLTTYYAMLHETATGALDNSVRNTKAYQTAAKTMVGLLAARVAVDDAVRAAAAAAGVTFP